MKLIKTDLYLLLIDEEAEISRTGTLIYENDTNLLNITGVDYEPQGLDSKIIAYYPLTKEAKELCLPLLPVTPKDKWGVHETHCCEKHGCKYGDNDCCVAIGIAKAKYPCEYCDDENDRQFSLEDMKKAIEMAREDDKTDSGFYIYSEKEIIQSLSTQQLPKEFIPEYDIVHTDHAPNGFEKLLKFKINSEGKKEIQGIYKY